MRWLLFVAALVFGGSVAVAAQAKCVLPQPDGGDEAPSKPNVSGRIAAIKERVVEVDPVKGKRKVVVVLGEQPEIYSAFGGDVPIDDLAVGQAVWVWFVDCKWPRHGLPQVAYFQVYSKDPNDSP